MGEREEEERWRETEGALSHLREREEEGRWRETEGPLSRLRERDRVRVFKGTAKAKPLQLRTPAQARSSRMASAYAPVNNRMSVPIVTKSKPSTSISLA